MPSCRRGAPTPGSSIGRVPPLAVHHIGLAVTDLADAIETYTVLLGGTLEHREVLVEQETTDPEEAYARFPDRESVEYREGWLPG